MSLALLISHWVLFTISCVSSTPLPKSPAPRIPFGNLTALNDDIAPGWVPSARSRGTADLLYSCITTLVLCVYTAIHLNIPRIGEPKWKQYVRKAKWAAMGIFAPEFVLYTAWEQFSCARKLYTKLNAVYRNRYESCLNEAVQSSQDDEMKKKRTKSKDTGDFQPFDLFYGFYAGMRGFVVDASDMFDSVQHRTLTLEGVLGLAKKGHFLRVNEHAIKDKSKADVLAKGLVCLQVTWLVVQCVARIISGYPISLLELHTFVHVVCALMMYGLWFKKPLGIHDPTVVETTAFRDLLARELVEEIGYAGPDGHKFTNRSGTVRLGYGKGVSERDVLHFQDEKRLHPESCETVMVAEQESKGSMAHIGLPKGVNEEVVTTLRTGQTLGSTGIGPASLHRIEQTGEDRTLHYTKRYLGGIGGLTACPFRIDLTARTVRRWERTASVKTKQGEATRQNKPWSYMWDRALNFQVKRSNSFDPFDLVEFRN